MNLFDRLRGKLPRPRLAKVDASVARKAPDAMIRAIGRSPGSQVAPALLLATGAGVALWWWTQWARGSAESEAAARDDAKD